MSNDPPSGPAPAPPDDGNISRACPEDRPNILPGLLEKARAAQRDWAALSFRARAGHVRAVRDAIVAEADRIAEIISRDNGKTRIDALSAEVLPAAMSATYYAKKAAGFLKPKKIRAGNILFLNKKSHPSMSLRSSGSSAPGIIRSPSSPRIAMAFMAGNAVLLKAASRTPKSPGLGYHRRRPVSTAFSSRTWPACRRAGLSTPIDKLFFTVRRRRQEADGRGGAAPASAVARARGQRPDDRLPPPLAGRRPGRPGRILQRRPILRRGSSAFTWKRTSMRSSSRSWAGSPNPSRTDRRGRRR